MFYIIPYLEVINMTVRNEKKPYYLGLTLDDTSIGWALTDPAYNILRASRKDAWGTRLFSAAETAEKARAARMARRTLRRKHRNIAFLRQVFEKEINKVDPLFFKRMDESKLYLDDRSADNQQKNALFNDPGFDDKDYFKQYPTIYHLKKDLMTSKEPRDIRLVYLALLHYFKHRGHFYAKAISADNGVVDIAEAYAALQENAAFDGIDLPEVDAEKLIATLCDTKHSPSVVEKSLEKLLGAQKPEVKELCKLMCGLTGRVDKIFADKLDNAEEAVKLSFTSETADDDLAALNDILNGDAMRILELAQSINNARQLREILGNEKYYTYAQISSYEEHKHDKYMLKTVLHKYNQDAYRKMFYEDIPASYAGYVNQNNSDKHNKKRRLFDDAKAYAARSQESFYKNVTEVLENLPEEAQNDPLVQTILERIKTKAFMPKQRTRANAIVPNQLMAAEFKLVVENASNYLPFLNIKDQEYGLSAKDKLIQLFSFTIPYYIGPVGQANDKPSRFAWSVYRPGKGGALYPWNLEEKIDLNRSAKMFINNLVGHCTYLPAQKVLPRGSMLYERYIVLNDLNSIKVKGKKISVEAKQRLYNDLYLKGSKVTHKAITNHLEKIGAATKEDLSSLTYAGSYNGPTCFLSSLGKFKNIFSDEFIGSYYDVLEDVIFLSTVFGDGSKDRLREELYGKYGNLFSQEVIEKLLKLSFTGWGNFSKEFLTLEGKAEGNKEEGDFGNRSIIDMMWLTNNTLQELLYSGYSYENKIEQLNKDSKFKSLEEWDIEDLNRQYIHVTLRKALWQARSIILDVERIMGYPPAKIFVQRAKGGQPPKKTNRKKELLALYKDVHDSERNWIAEIEAKSEADFRSRKTYLYYLQMGRCMYTGKKISLEDLNTSKYDRDHIYPKSKTDDNSITNLVLVDQDFNREKSDEYPISKEIRENMKDFWKDLLDLGFMSKEKYERLVRETNLSEDELATFINRRMKDTRPGTKTAYKLLKMAYKNTDTEVIFTNSSLVADFRSQYQMQESTIVNNLYPAHDAYLNIVCGNVFHTKFSADTHLYLYKNRSKKRSYNLSRMYDRDVLDGTLIVWKAEDEETGEAGTIDKVRQMISKTSALITKMPEHVDAELFNETLYSKKMVTKGNDPSIYIPLKTGLDPMKYGGKRSAKAEYYALCDYTKETKSGSEKIRALIPVLLLWEIDPKKEGEKKRLAKLIQESLNKKSKKARITKVKVVEYPIYQQSKLEIEGFRYWLGGKADDNLYYRQAVPMFIPDDLNAYVKKLEKAANRKSYDEMDHTGAMVLTKDKNLACFEYLVAKLESGIYKNMKCNIVGVLNEGREAFKELPLEKQCQLLVDLFMWNNGKKQSVNLQLIGGKASSGVMMISSKLSSLNEAYIIKESATGLSSRKFSLLD